ncbi:MAG: hypothetical protein KUG78_19030, partial [Kangiellaceae bacterium]|nr:hypothetical protein [Kangiellaceae bacterium]
MAMEDAANHNNVNNQANMSEHTKKSERIELGEVSSLYQGVMERPLVPMTLRLGIVDFRNTQGEHAEVKHEDAEQV